MRENGQALIETVLFFLCLAGFLGALLGFTKWFAIRQKLLMAAREGALLYSGGRLEIPEVEQRLRRFLITGSPALREAGLGIQVNRHPNPHWRMFDLDLVTVRYTSSSPWFSALGLRPTLEETCIIRHAPHYGPPFQNLLGPPVRRPVF